jgi:hypothetical protein
VFEFAGVQLDALHVDVRLSAVAYSHQLVNESGRKLTRISDKLLTKTDRL